MKVGDNVRFKNLFTKAKNAITNKTNSLNQTEKTLSSVIGGMAKTVIATLSLPIVTPILIGTFVIAFIAITFMQITSYPAVVFGVGTDSTNYCNEDPSDVETPYEPLEGGLAIPLYIQGDPRWGSLTYYNNDGGWHRYITLSAGGCDSTSFSMVASYLLDRTIYPSEIITHLDTSWRTWNGYFGRISEIYGINKPTQTSNWDDMKEAIQNHQPVIAWYSGASGIFTKAGHFIVVRGMTADGKYLVNDPTDNMVDYKHDYYKRKFTEEEMRKAFGWGVIFEAKDCEFDEGTTDYLQWAIDIANDDSHGYSQCNRLGPDYDCSSLVWHSLLNSGYSKEELGGYAFSTRTMEGVLTNIGFVKHSYNESELQAGDILWRSGHTGIYAGDGQVVQASSSREGNGLCGRTGDQTGTEIWVSKNTGNWSIYYRKG